MASGTLYTYPDSFRAFKALIAAQYSGAKVTVVSEAPGFQLGETNKSEGFLKKFPAGKVPAFESADGDCIFESNAIAYFLGNEQLRGRTPKDATKILQWINFADNEILPSVCQWVFPCLGILPNNKGAIDQAREQVKTSLAVLDRYLATRTFLVGERVTQADIAIWCDLLLAYKHVLDANCRGQFVNVNRWFVTLANQPQFKTVAGETQLCEKMGQFDQKKYQELHQSDKKDGGKKKEKQKQQEQKAPAKPKPKEEPEEEEDATDEVMAAEPKQKDPFTAYPKGSFDMDEFKRTYSNEDTVQVALPHFWNKVDKAHYSVWYCEYKFPTELTMVFMSCNLISGMFQRLEKLRKNAFASVVLFGENNASTISGVWVWRGPDLAFELSPDWQIDYESYEWKKLDWNDANTKKLVDEYFAWEGEFGGKKFNQGKIFK